MTDHILQHREAGVLTLTLNRPERKNALSAAMYAALADALNAAAHDAATRAAVIQGSESVFTAGNDIEEFLQRKVGDISPAMPFLRAVAAFPKPLLAAVCGPAVGVGTTLLLHCDLVYAGDNAAFSTPFVNLGLCPEAASSLLLPQAIGARLAAQMLLLGEPLGAEDALACGLINRIVPPTECHALAQAQAARLAAKPLAALMQTKRLMKGGQQQAVLQRMEEEREVFARMLGEPPAREALGAFVEKRKPDFSGM